MNQPSRWIGKLRVGQRGEIAPPALDDVLTPTQRRILVLLALVYPSYANPKLAISQETGHRYRDAHNATVHVSRLRTKLAPYGVRVRSAVGRGYRLEAT